MRRHQHCVLMLLVSQHGAIPYGEETLTSQMSRKCDSSTDALMENTSAKRLPGHLCGHSDTRHPSGPARGYLAGPGELFGTSINEREGCAALSRCRAPLHMLAGALTHRPDDG